MGLSVVTVKIVYLTGSGLLEEILLRAWVELFNMHSQRLGRSNHQFFFFNAPQFCLWRQLMFGVARLDISPLLMMIIIWGHFNRDGMVLRCSPLVFKDRTLKQWGHAAGLMKDMQCFTDDGRKRKQVNNKKQGHGQGYSPEKTGFISTR